MKAKKSMHHLVEDARGDVVFACMAVDIVECLDVVKSRAVLPRNVQLEACLLAGADWSYLWGTVAVYTYWSADTYNNFR